MLLCAISCYLSFHFLHCNLFWIIVIYTKKIVSMFYLTHPQLNHNYYSYNRLLCRLSNLKHIIVVYTKFDN